jgi:4-hydroxybenzoate polyprenyltransferase
MFSLALAYEQHLVRPDDISQVNVAFFNVNGTISILLFLFGAADVIWQ